jgi:hypothetical protein
MNFTGIDPIKALYWSAVINGILAAPVMGGLVVRGWLYALGWASTAAMALCIIGMLAGLFLS